MTQGFYGGYMGNAGAMSDLVYRGEPNQAMQLPYMPGSNATVNDVQLLSQGIPGFQDPRLPMTQDQFQREVEELRFKRMFPNPGDFRQYLKDYQRQNPLGRQASVPDGFDAKYVS